MKVIHTADAPQPIGPYVQAIEHEGMIYLSGMLPINPDTGAIEATDIAGMSEQIMRNIIAVLAQTGSDLTNVVKTTIYLTDMTNFTQVNEVYGKYFAEHKPARTCVAVAALPLNAEVEIEVIAKV